MSAAPKLRAGFTEVLSTGILEARDRAAGVANRAASQVEDRTSGPQALA
jgi:hypothetical protein